MTREEALNILKEPDRIGCNFIKSNDEEANKFNADTVEAFDMAISALSAEGEYIKKEDVLKGVRNIAYNDFTATDGEKDWFVCNLNEVHEVINSLPTYSFPDREKGEQLYSDLLRVKHGTMNIDSLIDKVYADMMRGKANE